MPLYDYRCELCGGIEERVHGMNERPTIKCSGCNGTNMQRYYANQRVQMGEVFHGYYDKLENQYFSTKKSMKEYSNRHDKVFASNEEIKHECDKNQKERIDRAFSKSDDFLERSAARIASMD